MTAALREDMEPRFDHDFSSVRIHADMLAAKSARDLNARAYTVGHDIVFGSGQFAAGTRQGRHLIAHELTHVVQQRGAGGIVQRVPDAEDPKSDDQSSMPALDEGQVQSSGIKVDQLNVITSPAGAFSGFPVAKGIDLNTPGPFNDTTTMGSCVNVHQMQFHLSKGDPNEVKLLRRVVRVSSAGGKETREGEKDKPKDDGPSAGSVIRPKESPNVVVADAPGFVGFGDASKSKGVFPVSYDADFDLFATDRVEPRFLAKLQYTVRISKKAPDDANPVNEIKVQTRKLF